jgi:hypothetical protein
MQGLVPTMQGRSQGAEDLASRDEAAHQAGTHPSVQIAHGRNEIGLTSGPHKLASKERKEEVKKGGNDLASRLEWRASSVMGRNRFKWRLNMKTC